MDDLHPSHLHLLALARAAIDAESGITWKTAPEKAIERHGAACDALWNELRHQIDAQDGKVPVLEHPSVQQKRLAMRMRRVIVASVNSAITEALDNMDLTASGEMV